MKKKSFGIAILIFVIIFIIFFGMKGGKSPYNPADLSKAETYLLDDSETGTLTDEEKSEKYTKYLENTLADNIVESYPAVSSAEVNLPKTEDTTQIALLLELSGSLEEENLTEIAKAVASAVGSSATEDIVIQDTEGTILYMKNTP